MVSPDSTLLIRQMIWTAYATPEKFDSTHRHHLADYYGSALVTENDGTTRVVVFGATEERDTYGDDDLAYLRSILDNFLNITGIIAYGDDVSGIQAAMSNLQHTKQIVFPAYDDSDTWESYANKISDHLKLYDLCILREKDGANFIVSPCNRSNKIIMKMKDIGWDWQRLQ